MDMPALRRRSSLGLARLPRCGTSALGSRYTPDSQPFDELFDAPEFKNEMKVNRCLLIASLITVGCEAASAPGESVLVRDSAGVRIIESADVAWDSSTAWTLAATSSVRIGADESGEAGSLFGYVRGLTRLSDGHIVVLEGQVSEVRWFNPDGTHKATRGGRGKGPGEFTSATALIKLAGDTVLVADAPRIKHVLYGPDTELIREEFLDYQRYRNHGLWLECLNLTLPDRSLLGCQAESGLQASPTGEPGRLRTFSRYVLVPWSMDTAFRLGLHGGIEQWGVKNSRGTISYVVHPYYARTVVASGGNPLRIALALNPDYSIEIWSTDGVLERIIRRRGARQAATSQQLSAAEEGLRFYSFGDDALFNRMMSEMSVPDSIPAVSSLVFGPDGELWVGRPGTNPGQYDVFDRDGVLMGEVAVPSRFGIREVGRDYVLGVRSTEDNVSIVELYALHRGGGNASN